MTYSTLDMTYLTLDMTYLTLDMTYLTLDITYLALDIYIGIDVEHLKYLTLHEHDLTYFRQCTGSNITQHSCLTEGNMLIIFEVLCLSSNLLWTFHKKINDLQSIIT